MEKHIPAHSTSPCRGCKHYSGKQFVPLHKARAFVGALFFGKLNPAGVGFADPDHDLTPRRLFGLGGQNVGALWSQLHLAVCFERVGFVALGLRNTKEQRNLMFCLSSPLILCARNRRKASGCAKRGSLRVGRTATLAGLQQAVSQPSAR